MGLLNFSSLQVLLGSIRSEREAEAAAHQDHLHQLAAQGAGAGLRRDPLPGHLHARGAGAEDRPDRGPRAGEQDARARPRFFFFFFSFGRRFQEKKSLFAAT